MLKISNDTKQDPASNPKFKGDQLDEARKSITANKMQLIESVPFEPSNRSLPVGVKPFPRSGEKEVPANWSGEVTSSAAIPDNYKIYDAAKEKFALGLIVKGGVTLSGIAQEPKSKAQIVFGLSGYDINSVNDCRQCSYAVSVASVILENSLKAPFDILRMTKGTEDGQMKIEYRRDSKDPYKEISVDVNKKNWKEKLVQDLNIPTK